MSKQTAVLAKIDEVARRHGVSYLAAALKEEFSSLWSKTEDEAPAAPAAPSTDTFNVTVGVEVLSSAYARQSDVEAGVRAALEQAASRRDEVVSFSVAGA